MRLSYLKITLLALILAGLTACSTRGKVDQYDGSTAQRLVTYSINNLMAKLEENDLRPFANKKVFLETHFIQPSPVLDYANARLRMELEHRFFIQLVDRVEHAEMLLQFFFTSLGTDKDTFGLSIPIFWVATDGEEAYLDILAVNMYHGVSEAYFFSKDLNTGKVDQHNRVLDRSRADVFSTPIISFPLDDLDEMSLLE